MDCPRCENKLQKESVRDFGTTIEIDYCASCGGAWFDEGELSRFEKIVEPVFWELKKVPSASEQMKELCCPTCEDKPVLEKRIHDRDDKVIFDYCPSCKGIWLDKGELEAIQKENWLKTMGRLFRWIVALD